MAGQMELELTDRTSYQTIPANSSIVVNINMLGGYGAKFNMCICSLYSPTLNRLIPCILGKSEIIILKQDNDITLTKTDSELTIQNNLGYDVNWYCRMLYF